MVSERDELPAKLPRVINTTTSTQKAMPFDRRMILLTLRSLVMGVSTKICEMISQVIVIIFLRWGKINVLAFNYLPRKRRMPAVPAA